MTLARRIGPLLATLLLLLGGAVLVASEQVSGAEAPPAKQNAEQAAFSVAKLVDKLPLYQPAGNAVSGTIKSVGSDTMNNLMSLWAEGFKKAYPNVQIEIEGKGSSTAPVALISGTANFGPMSRDMKASEIDHFENHYGYKPTRLRTAIDVLAVYVHKDNPIQSLTMQQVDAIFSKTRRRGAKDDIKTWGDLGLEGEWASKPITLYGRNAASGTYGFFKDHALGGGDFKAVNEQPGSSSVVTSIARDKYAIGYSGIGYRTADVKAVPLAKTASRKPVSADAQNAYTGKYPLWRFLVVYVNYQPGSQLDPLRREFIKYMLSRQGQSDVINDGYLPITPTVSKNDLEAVGIRD